MLNPGRRPVAAAGVVAASGVMVAGGHYAICRKQPNKVVHITPE